LLGRFLVLALAWPLTACGGGDDSDNCAANSCGQAGAGSPRQPTSMLGDDAMSYAEAQETSNGSSAGGESTGYVLGTGDSSSRVSISTPGGRSDAAVRGQRGATWQWQGSECGSCDGAASRHGSEVCLDGSGAAIKSRWWGRGGECSCRRRTLLAGYRKRQHVGRLTSNSAPAIALGALDRLDLREY
jgi:hypothetical protein